MAAIYFAFVELSARYLYFLLYQETTTDPTLKITPNVLFLSNELPTQYASVKLWIFTPLVLQYHK